MKRSTIANWTNSSLALDMHGIPFAQRCLLGLCDIPGLRIGGKVAGTHFRDWPAFRSLRNCKAHYPQSLRCLPQLLRE